jgi:hypothetical protein
VVDFHLKTLAAPLKSDYVCMESYGASTPAHLLTIRTAHPDIRTMMLVYDSFPLCQQAQLARISRQPDMIGFWEVDNYPHWIAGGGKPRVGVNELDPNWRTRSIQFTAGDLSFCPALLARPPTDPYR